MFGARGVALGLGGGTGGRVKLNDLRNLGAVQQKHQRPPITTTTTATTNTTNGSSSSASQVRRHYAGETIGCGRSRSRATENINNHMDDGEEAAKSPGIRRKRSEKRAKIVIKKSLDKSTFYSVCRATVFGILLMGLGGAMCTLGFYKDHFAGEMFDNGNSTTKKINPSVRVQFESLSYIGPCVMGAGAFVLMIACVMTMEGREQSLTGGCQEPLLVTTTDNDRKKSSIKPTVAIIDHQDEKRNFDDNNNGDAIFVSPEEVSGGQVNKCYAKDELKSNSTTTTTLTWSKTAVVKCEPSSSSTMEQHRRTTFKYPSLPCIDAVVNRSHDARALLQRFLEDESRLVDDRICRLGQRRRRQTTSSAGVGRYLPNQSVSLDAAGAVEKSVNPKIKRCVKSEEIPAKRKVVAEVHHYSDDASGENCSKKTSAAMMMMMMAPVAQDETYSPMSLGGSSCQLSIDEEEHQDDNTILIQENRSATVPYSRSFLITAVNDNDDSSTVTIDLQVVDNLPSSTVTTLNEYHDDIKNGNDGAGNPINLSPSTLLN